MTSVKEKISKFVDDFLCHYLRHYNIQWTPKSQPTAAEKVFVESFGNQVIEMGQSLSTHVQRIFDDKVSNISEADRFADFIEGCCLEVFWNFNGFHWESLFSVFTLFGQLSLLCFHTDKSEFVYVAADTLNEVIFGKLDEIQLLGGLNCFVSWVLTNFAEGASSSSGVRKRKKSEDEDGKSKRLKIGESIMQLLRPRD